MAGPAGAVAAPLYVGGAVVAYGLMYAVNPEFRAAHESLGSAMAQGASDSYGQIKDLIFGEEEAAPAPATGTQTQTQTQTGAGATTDTATGEARCPARPYWHFTDLVAGRTILSVRAFYSARNHFADRPWGPRTVFHSIFISNPLYVHKPHFFVQIMADCTVPLVPGESWGFVQEFIHAGRLNERPPHVTIVTGGPNIFPEYPGWEEFPIK